jgi:hypothetical protein
LVILNLIFLGTVDVPAQDNSDCLACHSDETLEVKRNGKSVSLYVDEQKFSASAHTRLFCVSCHANLKDKDLPHEESLAKVNCGVCHTKEQEVYSTSLHGKALARLPRAARIATVHTTSSRSRIPLPQSTVGLATSKSRRCTAPLSTGGPSLGGTGLLRAARIATVHTTSYRSTIQPLPLLHSAYHWSAGRVTGKVHLFSASA